LGIRDVNQWDETGDCEANRVEPAEAGTCGTSALTFVARGRRSDEIGGSGEPERWTVRRTWRSSRPPVAVGSSPSRPSRTLRRAREQWLPTIPCHRVLLACTALVCSGERGAGTALRHHLRHVTCIRNHLGSLCRPASARQLPPRPITRLRHRPRLPARAFETRSVLVVSRHLDGLLRAPHRNESGTGPTSGRTRSQVYCNLLPTGVRRVSAAGDSPRDVAVTCRVHIAASSRRVHTPRRFPRQQPHRVTTAVAPLTFRPRRPMGSNPPKRTSTHLSSRNSRLRGVAPLPSRGAARLLPVAGHLIFHGLCSPSRYVP